MCRSIKVLRVPDEHATRDEISAAALQFVRKVSGYRKPSRANEQAFNRAIVEISSSVEHLLGDLTGAPAKPKPSRIRRVSANAMGPPRVEVDHE
jgi:hypothetical protein